MEYHGGKPDVGTICSSMQFSDGIFTCTCLPQTPSQSDFLGEEGQVECLADYFTLGRLRAEIGVKEE